MKAEQLAWGQVVTVQTPAGLGIPEATGGHLEHPGERRTSSSEGTRMVQSTRDFKVIRPGVISEFGCLVDM